MKKYIHKILPYLLTLEIIFTSFFSCVITVYAADFVARDIVEAIEYGIEYNDWKPFYDFLYSSADGLMYMFSQMGAFVTKDFQAWVNNNNALESLANTVPARKEGDNIVFTKELMTQLKAVLDQYAKEHEPYYMANTLTLDYFTGSTYQGSKLMYDTAKNLLEDSPSGVIAFGAYYSHPVEMYFVDIGNDFRNVSPVKSYNQGVVNFYNNETWGSSTYTAYYVMLDIDDEPIKTASEFKEKATRTFNFGTNLEKPIGYLFKVYTLGETIMTYPYNCIGQTSMLSLVTKEKRRIRVFNTYGDFQNYTLGKRSVYYTSKYYEYVPDDITVSIDELQKSIDDMQKIIDDLLDRITDRMDESEIEELLRQILEALKNQQGTGSGSGSGNVTVNVDMATTNNWLSKIYSKVSQISDKLSSSASQSMSEVVESIENLQKMLKKYLSEITGDLDDIKGQLEEMSEQEFTEKTESFLDDTLADFSEIGEKAKGKFPFSIPNDIRLLISKMSVSPPEDPDQGTYSVQTMSFDADHESNGLVSVMDEGGGDVPVISETGAPIFYIPFVIASAGIDQYVVIDLSGFESISSFCRSLMTIFFILCLFNLTFKVMGLWGDLVD